MDQRDEFETYWTAIGAKLVHPSDKEFAARVFRAAYEIGRQDGFYEGMKHIVQLGADHITDEVRADMREALDGLTAAPQEQEQPHNEGPVS